MRVFKLVGRIVAAGVAYVVGMAVMGMLGPALHLPGFKPVPGMNPQHAALLLLLTSPLLAIGLLPLASHLKGSWSLRCAAIAALAYVTLGLNTLIEAKIFSNVLDGSPWLASVQFLLPCIACAAVLTYGPAESGSTPALGDFGAAGWSWRVPLAWLAFPFIYLFFGMCVAPFVTSYYNNLGALGLHIPPMTVIVRTQLLRSALFMAASLPAILLWTKSRGWLIFALGLAHAMTVGIFQLAQATFLPMTLRVAHSLEITCDSFAYAAVLVLLFAHSAKAAKPAVQGTAAAAD